MPKCETGLVVEHSCVCKGSGLVACHKCCGWTGGKTCKNACNKAYPKEANKYAPEPSSQYELDSFEIGTESAICEDCGEIHELEDEYEFGAHDEYEEVDHCNPKHDDYDPDYRCHKLATLPPRIPSTKDMQMPRSKRKTLRKMQSSKGKKKRNYTSEPITDYIMRALQPKKSVHPEYGKLRY
jgi:hypothetical protein